MTLAIVFTDTDRSDLCLMWVDPAVSYRKIHQRFDLHPDVLRRMARDLGLGARPVEAMWTDERLEILKDGFDKGESFSQIARRIGHGCSKNAAIGKAIRMGWKRGHAPARPATPRRSVERPAPALRITDRGAVFQEPEARPARAVIPFREEPAGSRDILTISPSGECHWPIGDPQDADFTLCGAKAEATYCIEHAKRAYAPPAPKKYVDSRLLRTSEAQRSA